MPSVPRMISKTMASSRADRQMGPTLSMLQLRAIAPVLLTLPNVGLNPVTPHWVEGETIDPSVSVPIEKATSPADVPEADPADDPLDPCFKFQGFFVTPPYQMSPLASAPIENLHTRTAPASNNFFTTVAVWSKACSLK